MSIRDKTAIIAGPLKAETYLLTDEAHMDTAKGIITAFD